MTSLSPRSKNKTLKLSDEVRAALEASDIAQTIGRGYRLKLAGQLDRATYVAVDKVIKAMGGKWNRSAEAHLFDSDPREIFGLAVTTGEVVDKKKSLGQFFTPVETAREIVALAGIRRHDRVLEPSAGCGHIADAIRELTAVSPTCVEIDPDLCEKLRNKGYFAILGDFLEESEAEAAMGSDVDGYDVVVMNPPFLGNEGVRHILRAYDLLAPGGRLFAIAPKGAESGSTKYHAALRSLILASMAAGMCGRNYQGGVEDMRADTFAEAGTHVRTVLIKLTKPVVE